MTPEFIVHLLRDALLMAFWIGAPLLVLGLTVSLVVNIIQIVTSLQDSAFSTIPRLAAFLFGLIALLPWMLNKTMGYTVSLLADLHPYLR